MHKEIFTENFNHPFVYALDEILSERTRMTYGRKYGKIFHKLNSFWVSKW